MSRSCRDGSHYERATVVLSYIHLKNITDIVLTWSRPKPVFHTQLEYMSEDDVYNASGDDVQKHHIQGSIFRVQPCGRTDC